MRACPEAWRNSDPGTRINFLLLLLLLQQQQQLTLIMTLVLDTMYVHTWHYTVRILLYLLQVKAGGLRYCNMKQSTLHCASSCMKSTDALVPRVPAVTEGC
jgi:hypothetical protein